MKKFTGSRLQSSRSMPDFVKKPPKVDRRPFQFELGYINKVSRSTLYRRQLDRSNSNAERVYMPGRREAPHTTPKKTVGVSYPNTHYTLQQGNYRQDLCCLPLDSVTDVHHRSYSLQSIKLPQVSISISKTVILRGSSQMPLEKKRRETSVVSTSYS